MKHCRRCADLSILALLTAAAWVTFPTAAEPGQNAAPTGGQTQGESPGIIPYTVEDVSLHLAGTLTLPRAEGPVAAVLLIRGPGPQARDDTRSENRPFLALTEHLIRLGIAVLNVDLRGSGEAARGPASSTTRDFASDVRDGLAYLGTHRAIAPGRIGLIGHGEGASIATIVAAGNADVAFTVLLASSGIPGDELLLQQFASVARAQGTGEEVVARELAIRKRVFDLVKTEADGTANIGRRRALAEELTNALQPHEKEHVQRLVDALLNAASTPWFRFFLGFDPRAHLARVRTPVLALTGQLDLQAPHRENLPAIRAALEAAGNRNQTVASLPGLNHLFQSGSSGTFAPSALKLISDWILARVR